MELATGVYLSSAIEDAWERDTDPPGDVRYLITSGPLQAGLWRAVPGVTPDPVRWMLPAREVILVLDGAARIEIEGGPTLDLGVGDMASLPAGAVTTWHLDPGFKELWVLGQDAVPPS